MEKGVERRTLEKFNRIRSELRCTSPLCSLIRLELVSLSAELLWPFIPIISAREVIKALSYVQIGAPQSRDPPWLIQIISRLFILRWNAVIRV